MGRLTEKLGLKIKKAMGAATIHTTICRTSTVGIKKITRLV